jgi:hypothetical protein
MTDYKEFYEERAAIREYEGGYSREEAEKLAYAETLQKMKKDKENDNQNGKQYALCKRSG